MSCWRPRVTRRRNPRAGLEGPAGRRRERRALSGRRPWRGGRGGGRVRHQERRGRPDRGWGGGRAGEAGARVGVEAAAGDLVASSERARGLLRREVGVGRARGATGGASLLRSASGSG